MKHSQLARWLKGISLFIVLIGILFYVGIIPEIIKSMAAQFPEFAYIVNPSIIAIDISAIPVCVALYLFWRICTNISMDKSFCRENSKALSLIGICAIVDTIYCFAYSVYLCIVGAINPGVFSVSLGIIIVGLAIAIAAFLVARLVEKACELEEETKFTV